MALWNWPVILIENSGILAFYIQILYIQMSKGGLINGFVWLYGQPNWGIVIFEYLDLLALSSQFINRHKKNIPFVVVLSQYYIRKLSIFITVSCLRKW